MKAICSQIVFFDPALGDIKQLLQHLPGTIKAISLHSGMDAIEQITAHLRHHQGVSALHIVTHGVSGQLQFCNTVLSGQTINHYWDHITSWSGAMAPDADILLYGCESGKGQPGRQLIEALACASGCNVAASPVPVGHHSLGARWQLSEQVGEVTTPVFTSIAAQNSWHHRLGATLNAADLAVVSYNSDGDDTFALIALANIPGSSVIHITDDGYKTGSGFDLNEGTSTWTVAAGGLSAGTIIRFTNAGAATALVDPAHGAITGSLSLSAQGDQLFIYQTDDDISSGTIERLDGSGGTEAGILYGFNADLSHAPVNGWHSGMPSSLSSNAPDNATVLTTSDGTGNSSTANANGMMTVAITELDNYRYDGPTGATDKASWLTRIHTSDSNWLGDNSTVYDMAQGALTSDWTVNITNAAPTITLPTAPTVNEDDTNVAIADNIEISDTDGDYQSVTLTITGGTATLTITTDLNGLTGNGSASITFSGARDNVNTALDSLTFTPTPELSGTGAGKIQIQTTDVNGGADDETLTFDITAVNDEPTLTATGSDPTFSGPAADLFSGVTADTVEGGQTLEELKITVTNVADGGGANEFLSIDGESVSLNTNSGTTTNSSIAYSVVLSGGTATVTLTKAGMTTAAVQTLIDDLSYSNDSSSPSASDRVVTLTSLKDSGGTANGGDDTNSTLSIQSTVTMQVAPGVSSSTYDYSSNQLVVTGTSFIANGGGSDVDVSLLTLTGEGGANYTLSSSSDVEIDSATQFTVTLTGLDLYKVEALFNKDGLSADDSTTYNLAAADDFITAYTSGDTSDATNSVTVSNYAVPTITSATYDVSTGQLVLTGTDFVNQSGATNDVDVSLFTITSDNGASYTLTDSSDVEISSATSATIILSSTDQLNAHGLLNKDGTTADSGTTYNLAAAEDWMTGAPATNNVVDATGNGITVSNVATPTVTSATYSADSGLLIVTGTNLFKEDGSSNDIDISTLTFTGGVGDATYTLTSSTDVEITSATSFSVTLSGADKTNVDGLLDQIGTSSSGGSTYNLAAADNWLTGAAATPDIADLTSNAITVSMIDPEITSATYDAAAGTLVVTGTNIQANGGGADIDASLFTLTGEGGATYTLTDTADVERDSLTQFTFNLSATDQAALNQIINKNGTTSTSGTTFNLAAADDWNTSVTAGDTADATGNGITVSNVAAPTITSATYDATAGALVVTGTGLLQLSGGSNDVDVSKLTFTGEGGATYTLTDSSDVEITSGTAFSVSLSANDQAALNQIINKDGTSSTSGTTYNLAAAEDWAVGADASVNVVDATGNGITVSNVAAPTITSATYTTQGSLVVTGTGFLKADGTTNDIDVSKLSLLGEGNVTYNLTDSADVEISSATEFAVTLSSSDKAGVNALLNNAGTSSADSTTYNLAAAEDWAAGANASVNVADTVGNAVVVSIYTPPVSPSGPAPVTETVDGVNVSTTTEMNADGSTTQTIVIAPVSQTRTEDESTGNRGLADIPILQGESSEPDLSVALPVGVGLAATGSGAPISTVSARNDLIALIEDTVPVQIEDRVVMREGGINFLAELADASLWVNKLTLSVASGEGIPNSPIQISGQATGSNTVTPGDAQQIALVVDANALPPGTVLELNDISFAVVLGPVTLAGGDGQNVVYTCEGSQTLVLGVGDDELHGGSGDDTVGSKGGDNLIFGGNGSDTLFGGSGQDTLHGGVGVDVATYEGNLVDYEVVQVNGVITVIRKGDNSDRDVLINIETLRFSDQNFNPVTNTQQEAIATLYQQILGRQADVTGFQWWVKDIENGHGLGDVALAFIRSDEYQIKTGGTVFDNLSVDQQVESLYHAVLGRDSDSEGKAYWVAEADAGFSIEQMADAFVTSTELTGQYLQTAQWDFIL